MAKNDILNIGKTYGCYTILEFLPTEPHKKRYCMCKCEKCGKIRKMQYYKVTHMDYKYCPECKPKPDLKNDLTGKIFGKLKVLQRVENHIQPSGIQKIMYKCLCECGKETKVTSSHLISGHTISCGCAIKDFDKVKDLTGQKYGRLLVLNRLKNINFKETTWLCKCDCGNLCTATTRSFYKKRSCGCLISKAEDDFTNILNKHQISFIKQFKFDGCKDKKPLPFDFAIFDNNELKMLIELNGQQHYAPFTFCGENKEIKIKNFKDRIKKDKIKEDFCKKNNIPLLIISYKNFDKKWEKFLEFIQENGLNITS